MRREKRIERPQCFWAVHASPLPNIKWAILAEKFTERCWNCKKSQKFGKVDVPCRNVRKCLRSLSDLAEIRKASLSPEAGIVSLRRLAVLCAVSFLRTSPEGRRAARQPPCLTYLKNFSKTAKLSAIIPQCYQKLPTFAKYNQVCRLVEGSFWATSKWGRSYRKLRFWTGKIRSSGTEILFTETEFVFEFFRAARAFLRNREKCMGAILQKMAISKRAYVFTW